MLESDRCIWRARIWALTGFVCLGDGLFMLLGAPGILLTAAVFLFALAYAEAASAEI